MFYMLLFNFVNYVFSLLCMFHSGYSVLLCCSVSNLSCFQKGASYSGIRIFNSLPLSITSLKNEKTQFKVALNAHSFTLWMNFSHVQKIGITDLCDSVNVYNILNCSISYMFVCLWHVPHPIVLWQCQGSMECMYVCIYVCMYILCMYVYMYVYIMYVYMYVCK